MSFNSDPDLMPKKPVSPFMVAAIVLGNIIPLYGVLAWHWSIFDIVFLYWCENVLIGVLTFIRMSITGFVFRNASIGSTLFHDAFFTVHYGLFCFVHFAFVCAVFHPASTLAGGDGDASVYDLMAPGYWPAFAGIALGVMISGVSKIKADYENNHELGSIMGSPYGRVAVLHIVLLLGAFIVMAMGSPVWGLLLLIVLKIGYDILEASGIVTMHGPASDENEEKNKESGHH